MRQRQLLVNSLRMRPDRIIVGEVRGEEALDMLQAMNTGHDGSLTTVHANSPRDAISRLEVMVSLANANMHLAAIRQQIASAVQILVQGSRLSDGSRRVTSITEVTGMEADIVTLQDIFVFEKRGALAGRPGARPLLPPPGSCRSSTRSCWPRASGSRRRCSTKWCRWGRDDASGLSSWYCGTSHGGADLLRLRTARREAALGGRAPPGGQDAGQSGATRTVAGRC